MRISLEDICYNDALATLGLMIAGVCADGTVALVARRLLPCGHPATCAGRDGGCVACELVLETQLRAVPSVEE
jgi:hypothetical protein